MVLAAGAVGYSVVAQGRKHQSNGSAKAKGGKKATNEPKQPGRRVTIPRQAWSHGSEQEQRNSNHDFHGRLGQDLDSNQVKMPARIGDV